MSQQQYYYNEHDENQVLRLRKDKRKRKLKRKIKVVLILFVMLLIAGYFVSDISRVHDINMTGLQEVSKDDIEKSISVHEGDIVLFVNTGKIEDEIAKMPFIKKVKVTKSLLGSVQIEVEEAQKVAYCVIDKKTYVIDELGNVSETDDKDLIASLQSTPQITKFKDLQLLKEFAKKYVNIPEIIKSQTSDIIYDPQKADETRLKFIMDDGKILYLRIEDMVEQLNKFDYEANKEVYKDKCVFSFEGNYVYMKDCE